MDDCILNLYETILDRRENPVENSYTKYLFDKGLDKILKKIGEETAEVVIAAKNGVKQDTIGEIADLTYHVLVLMAQQGISPQEVADALNERHKKSGNLKTFHKTDKNT
ncbi:MAG: phosphoribosyl-ATP diphosphatase [Clostridiales bacterium]|jgi:phosphoribosyl-ATP pyrophosphohydrolase|nr:phosphoribosyl-ATP diphosphatase [Clostridiales bacterium]